MGPDGKGGRRSVAMFGERGLRGDPEKMNPAERLSLLPGSWIWFDLDDGLEVICRGRLEVYAPRGTYQLVIDEIQPKGLGALELALRQLREKLAAEGLFAAERKRPLPPFVRRIAVVTSPTGAALRDFLVANKEALTA